MSNHSQATNSHHLLWLILLGLSVLLLGLQLWLWLARGWVNVSNWIMAVGFLVLASANLHTSRASRLSRIGQLLAVVLMAVAFVLTCINFARVLLMPK